jgi:hypothetical protein
MKVWGRGEKLFPGITPLVVVDGTDEPGTNRIKEAIDEPGYSSLKIKDFSKSSTVIP